MEKNQKMAWILGDMERWKVVASGVIKAVELLGPSIGVTRFRPAGMKYNIGKDVKRKVRELDRDFITW